MQAQYYLYLDCQLSTMEQMPSLKEMKWIRSTGFLIDIVLDPIIPRVIIITINFSLSVNPYLTISPRLLKDQSYILS